MATGDEAGFAKMATVHPVRTSLFTLGPLLFALVQLYNGVAYDVSLLGASAFGLVLLGFAVQVNRYHLASFRRTSVSGRQPARE